MKCSLVNLITQNVPIINYTYIDVEKEKAAE